MTTNVNGGVGTISFEDETNEILVDTIPTTPDKKIGSSSFRSLVKHHSSKGDTNTMADANPPPTMADTESPPPSPAADDLVKQSTLTKATEEEEEETAPPVVMSTKDTEGDQEDNQTEITPPPPPGFFTDDRGNLKFVNLVVRNPCCIFWTLLVLCFVITFALIAIVFSEGNPFTDPANEFDLNDVRSIQYDSLRLAQQMVEEARDADDGSASAIAKQSETADLTYWVFEGQTPQGVFGTREAIENMKEAYDLFYDDPGFQDYCLLRHQRGGGGGGPPSRSRRSRKSRNLQTKAFDLFTGRGHHHASHSAGLGTAIGGGGGHQNLHRFLQEDNTTTTMMGGNSTAVVNMEDEDDEEEEAMMEEAEEEEVEWSASSSSSSQAGAQQGRVECDVPLTPLSMYYASEWDSALVAEVIEELKDPDNLDVFNEYSLCYVRGLFCEMMVPEDVSEEKAQYTVELNNKITQIISKWDMKGELVADHTQVTELASYMLLVDIYRGLIDFGFDKQFAVDNPVSHFSRGIIWWGGPLSDRTALTEEEKEEADEKDDEERKDFIVEHYLDEMNEQAKAGSHDTINSYYFMVSLIFDVILEIVSQDAMLAIASLMFVFVWLRINTGSWFLAGVGLFEIFFSIPVAWFIFTVIFQINYFATLNALSIFIVAAIGADDIFIFMDAYKQSKYRNPHNLVDMETRMSWVYRRTGTAMAITSATTCSAFLCTLITPLTSIQSFGIFAAVVIFIDYVLVMTLFCTAVVIYHDRYEDRGCCGCCCTNCTKTDPCPTKAAKEALESGDEDHKADFVSEFFRNRVAGFIKVPLHRAVLAAIFLSWLGVAIWQTTLIEPTKEAEQFLDENHPLQKSITIINREFPASDEDAALKVYYAWGLGEVDRSGVNLLIDPENYGQPTFVESFDFNKQCQTEMMNWCDKFRSDPEYHGLIKRKGGVGQAYCFMEELAIYAIQGNLSDCDYLQSADWKDEEWQLDPNDLPQLMDGFLQENSCFSDRNGNPETIAVRYANEMGWDGQTMRYAALAIESDVLNPFSQDAESVTRGEYDQFVAIAKEVDEAISQYCSGEVIMTDLDEKFVFMNNQSIYVQTAVQSAILGVAIAFVVLLISTRVLHIAFFASLSIISVLVSVTGTMVMLGWDLGSIESILIGIIAGFSVDYVVHLAHAYETAKGDTYERVTEAFGDMGISVLNGMITSVAASLPLFFCQLQFFAKFGTFLCLTIAYSWIFANFGFMSVLAQMKIPIAKGGCRL